MATGNRWRLAVFLAAGFWLSVPSWPQASGRFVQAELHTTITVKSAKVGDPVKASASSSVTLPNGVQIHRGGEIYGQVRAVDANSIAISFDEVEEQGKKTPLSLSIRGAMMPSSDPAKPSQDTAGQAGSVIGMPGVTLQVDDSPQHASKFESSNKKFQLKQGLQLMLAVPQ
jgi:hypothetical protein